MTEQDRLDRRRVFVIHGRNEPARKALFEFLRSVGLEPIDWSQALQMTGKVSPYIGEVLDAAFGAAQAVVVLETPDDDIAYLHPSLTYPDDPESEAKPQPRPNVLFEAGMAMGRDPDRTVIVELGQVKVFSDIHGRHVVRLDNAIGKRQDLAQRLNTAGCAVNLSDRDWHDAGDLNPPPVPGGVCHWAARCRPRSPRVSPGSMPGTSTRVRTAWAQSRSSTTDPATSTNST
jgi:predicted nucleotide-binding protein